MQWNETMFKNCGNNSSPNLFTTLSKSETNSSMKRNETLFKNRGNNSSHSLFTTLSKSETTTYNFFGDLSKALNVKNRGVSSILLCTQYELKSGGEHYLVWQEELL